MRPQELQDVLAGRRRAIDRFVREHAATVEKAVAVALRGRVGSLPAATLDSIKKDIVGDTWCWLLDRERAVLRSYDPSRGAMAGFLFMKVCSQARRLHARRYRSSTEPIDDGEGAGSLAPPNGLGVRYEQYDHAKKLWEEIESHLSPAERAAFIGRILEGKSAREVAAELDRSEDAVHQGVSRAIKRARKVLARRGGLGLEGVLPLLMIVLADRGLHGDGGPCDVRSSLDRGEYHLEVRE